MSSNGWEVAPTKKRHNHGVRVKTSVNTTLITHNRFKALEVFEPVRFFDLPGEVRNHIYDVLLKDLTLLKFQGIKPEPITEDEAIQNPILRDSAIRKSACRVKDFLQSCIVHGDATRAYKTLLAVNQQFGHEVRYRATHHVYYTVFYRVGVFDTSTTSWYHLKDSKNRTACQEKIMKCIVESAANKSRISNPIVNVECLAKAAVSYEVRFLTGKEYEDQQEYAPETVTGRIMDGDLPEEKKS